MNHGNVTWVAWPIKRQQVYSTPASTHSRTRTRAPRNFDHLTVNFRDDTRQRRIRNRLAANQCRISVHTRWQDPQRAGEGNKYSTTTRILDSYTRFVQYDAHPMGKTTAQLPGSRTSRNAHTTAQRVSGGEVKKNPKIAGRADTRGHSQKQRA